MPLIASVSGIRGTIGGETGSNLTPEDIVRFTAAYGTWLSGRDVPRRVVLGRDGRMSGPMVQGLVMHTLQAMGLDVVDLGLTTTPTLEMAVPAEGAGGGIILTASHNPAEWNALKLLDEHGEFLSAAAGERILDLVRNGRFAYAPADRLGRHFIAGSYFDHHIEQILALPYVDAEAIRRRAFRVVVDGINSTGAMAMPRLLEALGAHCTVINPEVTGRFAHNPEPLPEHLIGLCEAVRREQADLGVAVDPDVDRLALVDELGGWFGEEYTLVAAADWVLAQRPGPVVHNLSSSRALRDVAARYGQPCYASAVGEVHVVRKMRETGAVIGGEGNGGVILPDLHYGRDALLGIALILTMLARRETRLSALRQTYPTYAMAKHKAPVAGPQAWEAIREALLHHYRDYPINEEDGLKVDLPDGWLHLRRSNTEPILRIYTEAPDAERAEKLALDTAALIQGAVNA